MGQPSPQSPATVKSEIQLPHTLQCSHRLESAGNVVHEIGGTLLHANAKEEPERRVHALADKVGRTDVLKEVWVKARRNGGSGGDEGRALRTSRRAARMSTDG